MKRWYISLVTVLAFMAGAVLPCYASTTSAGRTSFTLAGGASSTTKAYGDTAAMVPTFSGGVGVIKDDLNNTIVPSAVSGNSYSTGALTATRIYTLTVTNSAGDSVSANVTANVTPVTITPVAPANTTRTVSTATSFTATVSGALNASVAWNASAGSINASTGDWIAPATAQSVTITATSVANPAVFSTTTVAVVGAPSASIIANTSNPDFGGTFDLTPTYSNGTGSIDNGVTCPASGSATVPLIANWTGSRRYTLTVTNAAGSVATAWIDITPKVVVVGAVSPANPTRTVSTSTTFSTTVTGGATNAVTWSSTAGSWAGSIWTAPATAGGPYTITATSVDDPTKTATTTVTVVAAPVASSLVASSNNPLYAGTFTLTPAYSAGTGTIDNGVTCPATGVASSAITANWSGARTYTLTVTNAAGTTATATAVVTPQTVSVGAISPANPTKSASTVTTFSSTVTGGATNTVTWSASGGTMNASTGAWTAPATAGGPYTIAATSVDDPTKTATTTVTVVAMPSITSFSASPGTIGACSQSSTLTGVFANGTGSINQGIGAVTSSVGVGTGVLAATETYTLMVTNTAGDSVTANATVTVAAAPGVTSFTASSTSVGSCNTGVTLTPTFTGTGATAMIGTSAGGSQVTASAASGVGVPSGAVGSTQTYYLTVIDSFGCTTTSTVTVTVAAAPSVTSFTTSSSTLGSCQSGNSVTLTPTFTGTGATAMIGTSAGGSQVTASAASGVGVPSGAVGSTKTYYLTVTDSFGCTATSTVTVTVAAAPSVTSFTTSSSTLGSCQSGNSVTLTPTFTGTGATAKIGTTANGSQITASATSGVGVSSGAVGSTKTYYLTVTDSFGCTATSTVTVTVAAAPSVSSFTKSGDLGACGGSRTLSWNTTGTSVSVKIGTFSGGSDIVNGGAASGSTSVSPASTTTYYLTTTDSFGCTATSTVTVNVNSTLPLVSSFTKSGDLGACGGSSTLSWNTSGIGVSVNIGTFSGGSDIAAGAPAFSSTSVSPASTTTYYLTATDSFGCTATFTVTVNVSAAPTVSSFTKSGDLGGCGGSRTLSWNTSGIGVSVKIGTAPGGNTVVNSGAASGSTSVSPASTTTYYLTGTDSFGCTATSSVTVNVVAAPTVSSFTRSADLGSCGGSSTLSWTTTGTSVSVKIGTAPSGNDIVNSGAASSSTSVSPASTTTYYLTATDSFGCTATSSVTVTVSAAPGVSSFTASPGTINSGNSSTLSWTSTGTGVSVKIGTAPSGNDIVNGGSASSSTSVSPASTTTYYLTATDSFGCTATSAVTVTVNTLPGPVLTYFGNGTGVLIEMCGGEGTVDQYQYNDYIYFTGTFDTATLQNPLGGTVTTSLQEGLPNAFLIGLSEHWVPNPNTCGKGCTPPIGIGDACTNSEFADFLNDCAYRGTWTLTLVRNGQTSVYTYTLGPDGPEWNNSGQGWRLWASLSGYPLCP